jgi:recombination protein RecA
LFSIVAAPILRLDELRARFRSAAALLEGPAPIALGWPELADVLPDGGLPRGAVVELAAPHALGGASTVAALAVAALHASDARSFAAWIDPERTLFAPGLAQRGVDLARLLVVRPPREELLRVATKVCASGAMDVVVVDVAPVGTASASPRPRPQALAGAARRLGVAAEEHGPTVILLTDALTQRSVPLPVALRLELEASPDRDGPFVSVRVAKDRRGRVGVAKVRVPLPMPGVSA